LAALQLGSTPLTYARLRSRLALSHPRIPTLHPTTLAPSLARSPRSSLSARILSNCFLVPRLLPNAPHYPSSQRLLQLATGTSRRRAEPVCNGCTLSSVTDNNDGDDSRRRTCSWRWAPIRCLWSTASEVNGVWRSSWVGLGEYFTSG